MCDSDDGSKAQAGMEIRDYAQVVFQGAEDGMYVAT
jgi:hypothetical protein